MMKHFIYLDGSGVFQDAPIHKQQGFTDWFDEIIEYENDVNHMPWPLQSQDLYPIEHLWDFEPTC